MRTAFSHFATALGTAAAPPSVSTSSLVASAPTDPNVAVLQDFYNAVAHQDYERVGGLLCEDITFQIFGFPNAPETPLVGHAAVLGAFQANFEGIAPEKSVVETLLSQGDTLMLIATDEGQLLGSSTPYAVRFILELTFQNQKMHRVREWILPL